MTFVVVTSVNVNTCCLVVVDSRACSLVVNTNIVYVSLTLEYVVDKHIVYRHDVTDTSNFTRNGSL